MSRESPWPRALLFGGIALHMQLGPLWAQALGGSRIPLGMQWRMYSGKGDDVCEVVWSTPGPDGALRRVDSYEVLGLGDRGSVPPLHRHPRAGADLRRIAAMMCKRGPFDDLRATARCAVEGVWTDALDPTENLCASPPPPASRRRE